MLYLNVVAAGVLTLGWPRGGFVRPPPYVFSSYPLPGGEFGQNKNDT